MRHRTIQMAYKALLKGVSVEERDRMSGPLGRTRACVTHHSFVPLPGGAGYLPNISSRTTSSGSAFRTESSQGKPFWQRHVARRLTSGVGWQCASRIPASNGSMSRLFQSPNSLNQKIFPHGGYCFASLDTIRDVAKAARELDGFLQKCENPPLHRFHFIPAIIIRPNLFSHMVIQSLLVGPRWRLVQGRPLGLLKHALDCLP